MTAMLAVQPPYAMGMALPILMGLRRETYSPGETWSTATCSANVGAILLVGFERCKESVEWNWVF